MNYKLQIRGRLKGVMKTNIGVQVTSQAKPSSRRRQISGVDLRWVSIRQRKIAKSLHNFLDHSLDLHEFQNTDEDIRAQFEVLTAVLTKISVFWNIPPCRLVYRVRYFRGHCYLNLQDSRKRNKTHITDHTHKVQ